MTAIAANTTTETELNGIHRSRETPARSRGPQHGRKQPGPSASPVGGHRHCGEDRRERRDGEQWPGDARHRHARERHQDGEAIGIQRDAQEVIRGQQFILIDAAVR